MSGDDVVVGTGTGKVDGECVAVLAGAEIRGELDGPVTECGSDV
jgi:hypothetical protein